MFKVYAYINATGSVSVVIPALGQDHEAVIKKDIPASTLVLETTADVLPDRYFRDAWSIDEGGLSVDLPKARQIHVDKLRVIRNERLRALDQEWTKAVGQKKNQEADQIEALRQKLRDMPQLLQAQLDAAQSADAIKSIVPEELNDALRKNSR